MLFSSNNLHRRSLSAAVINSTTKKNLWKKGVVSSTHPNLRPSLRELRARTLIDARNTKESWISTYFTLHFLFPFLYIPGLAAKVWYQPTVVQVLTLASVINQSFNKNKCCIHMPTGQTSRDNSLIKVLFPGDSSFCHGEKTNLAFFF